MATEVDNLVTRMHDAFTGVTLGRGTSWREAEEIDNRAAPEDRAVARGSDVQDDWRAVDANLFDALPSAVYFLNEEGLRYYLPAFMVADIERNGRWQSAVDDGFLARLATPEHLSPLLTHEQRVVIRDWLELEVTRHPWHLSPALTIWRAMAAELE